VVLRPETQATVEEVRAWCGARLAAHKVPKHIEFTPSLPRTATGKIHKEALRAAGA
jgi:acyl-coenzyme A synthetase/AMP-(fatty) acid ligase